MHYPQKPIDVVPDDWGPKAYFPVADISLTMKDASSIKFTSPANFFLVLLTRQSDRRMQLASDRHNAYNAAPGVTEAIPEGADLFAEWKQRKENILVSVDHQSLQTLAQREFDLGHVELFSSPRGKMDSTAHRLGVLLQSAFKTDATHDSLYMESLTTALVLRLLSLYSVKTLGEPSDIVRGGLQPPQLKLITGYMIEHMATSISLAELASLAGVSHGHFMRAFRQSTGVSAYQYLLTLRLERAQDLISTTTIPLKEVATICGFSGRSHMITAMRTRMHITPGQIRKTLGRGDEES